MKGILAAALGLALASSDFSAHEPEGVVHTAVQWTPDLGHGEPVIDGEFGEWIWVPEEYVIYFPAHPSLHGIPPDLNDLDSEIVVSWSERQNKLFLMEKRYDDFLDLGDEERSGDSFELHLDGDHGGEPIWFSEEEYPDAKERAFNMGRWAQTYRQYLPGSPWEKDTWAGFWLSQSTWHDQPEYMEMAYRFMEGGPGGEGVLYVESSWTLWDEFIWNDPEASVQTDLEEGNVIGLGWTYADRDGPDPNEGDWWFLSGAHDSWKTSAVASDFLLAPVDPAMIPLPTPTIDDDAVVAKQSWGRIKEAFLTP